MEKNKITQINCHAEFSSASHGILKQAVRCAHPLRDRLSASPTAQDDRNNESGRSMVEMLGVLAIIGVLSVGGIAGYTSAMRSHRANEIVNACSLLYVVANTKNESGDIEYQTVFGTRPTGVSSLTYNNGTITANITDAAVCTEVKNKLGDKVTGDCTGTSSELTVTLADASTGSTTPTCDSECNPCQKCENDSCVADINQEGKECTTENNEAGTCDNGVCGCPITGDLRCTDGRCIPACSEGYEFDSVGCECLCPEGANNTVSAHGYYQTDYTEEEVSCCLTGNVINVNYSNVQTYSSIQKLCCASDEVFAWSPSGTLNYVYPTCAKQNDVHTLQDSATTRTIIDNVYCPSGQVPCIAIDTYAFESGSKWIAADITQHDLTCCLPSDLVSCDGYGKIFAATTCPANCLNQMCQ